MRVEAPDFFFFFFRGERSETFTNAATSKSEAAVRECVCLST